MPLDVNLQNPESIIAGLQQNQLNDIQLKELLLELTPEKLDADIISNWISALLDTSPSIPALPDTMMDCCGTGGSGLPHFNTSTIVAFVLAAAGIPVVKFGNRGIQQAHGSFDFLASLGFAEPLTIDKLPKTIESSHLAFLFAPQCYPYLAPIHKIRRTLTAPTLFHYIGPLLNPVLPKYRLLGISHQTIFNLISQVLISESHLSNALKQATLIHTSLDHSPIGLDEFSFIGKTSITQIPKTAGSLIPNSDQNDDVKIKICQLLNGITVNDSIRYFQQMLEGNLPDKEDLTIDSYAFCYSLVQANGALGLMTAGKVSSFEDGLETVSGLFKSQEVFNTFKKYQEVYNACR